MSRVLRRNTSFRALAGRLSVVALCTVHLTGCAAWPDRQAFGQAALGAARDPRVWAPLAGAAGLQVADLDSRLSHWARIQTPVFGSQAQAQRWSDTLRSAAVVADASTVLAMPTPADDSGWFLDKASRYAIDLAAATAAIGTTHVLKNAVGRTRPSAADDQSFPSGHATTASAYDRLAQLHLAQMELNPGTQQALTYGLDALSAGTAWARIEAGAHYPSDTLVGMAIGNFSARFFTAAFTRDADGRDTGLAVTPLAGGLAFSWRTRF